MTTTTFDTPEPIFVQVQASGTLAVSAADIEVTVVSVRPRNADREADVRAAEDTTVSYDNGVLRIHTPHYRGPKSWFGAGPAVVVTVDIPSDSRLEVNGWADTTTTGSLGDVLIDSGMGDVVVQDAASARITSAMGDIRVRNVAGDADLKTSAGAVDARSIGGRARLKTSAGNVSVGNISGTTDLRTAAGDIRVGTTSGEVAARTSAGEIRIDNAQSGVLRLLTSYGAIEVGIPNGTAAWLETDAGHGQVRTELGATDQPSPDDRTVEVHATTKYGDIQIRRARQEKP